MVARCMFVPDKFESCKSAPVKSAPSKFAFEKLAPDRSPPFKFAFKKLAPIKLDCLILLPSRFTSEKLPRLKLSLYALKFDKSEFL